MYIQQTTHKRSLLLKLAVFGVFVLIEWWAINLVYDRKIESHYELSYAELISAEVNADIIVIGNSRAVHGVDPRYLSSVDSESFNFSLNGASPLFYGQWYDQLFKRYYRRPSLLIYAVDWFMLDGENLQRQFEQDSEFFPRSVFYKTVVVSPARKQAVLSRFPRLKHQAEFIRGRIHDPAFLLDKYHRGYVPLHRQRDLKPKVLSAKIDIGQLRAFESLLDALSEDGIPVVFVQLPVFLRAHQQNQLDNIALRELAASREIPYLDYNAELRSHLNDDESAFLDWGHMSPEGSSQFTQRLKADLNRLALLPVDD